MSITDIGAAILENKVLVVNLITHPLNTHYCTFLNCQVTKFGPFEKAGGMVLLLKTY